MKTQIPFKSNGIRAELEDGQVTVSGLCTALKTVRFSVTVPEEQFMAWWRDRVAIQDAIPDHSPAEREFLMTGISPVGWEFVFGGFMRADQKAKRVETERHTYTGRFSRYEPT